VTRRCDRLEATPSQQEGQAQPDEAKRRLRILGQPQLIFVGRYEEASKVDACDMGAPVAKLRDFGIGKKLGPHPGLLGALPGKDERNLTHPA
jgi:hypothetical protein